MLRPSAGQDSRESRLERGKKTTKPATWRWLREESWGTYRSVRRRREHTDTAARRPRKNHGGSEGVRDVAEEGERQEGQGVGDVRGACVRWRHRKKKWKVSRLEIAQRERKRPERIKKKVATDRKRGQKKQNKSDAPLAPSDVKGLERRRRKKAPNPRTQD